MIDRIEMSSFDKRRAPESGPKFGTSPPMRPRSANHGVYYGKMANQPEKHYHSAENE
jgi:hypothetical protein